MMIWTRPPIAIVITDMVDMAVMEDMEGMAATAAMEDMVDTEDTADMADTVVMATTVNLLKFVDHSMRNGVPPLLSYLLSNTHFVIGPVSLFSKIKVNSLEENVSRFLQTFNEQLLFKVMCSIFTIMYSAFTIIC
jgi:hypothetical protein